MGRWAWGSSHESAWRTNGFDDSGWSGGEGPFGYGDGGEQTLLSYGPDSGAKFLTTYFRKAFVATHMPESFKLELKLMFSDGAAVFLNGTPVAVANLSSNATYLTPAIRPQDALDNAWLTYAVDPALLLPGTNLLAALR